MPSTSGSAVVVACTPRARGKSAMGMGVGKIVEVEGGHIIRATGLKDRHSKVCTAKGPRDRRVRLAAHTAIQFYDVQDRLGYDRPSKAVDWLIKNAKSAIDQLDQMPPWSPTSVNVLKSGRRKGKVVELGGEDHGLYDNGDTDGVSLLTPSLNYTHGGGGGGGGAVGQNEDLRLSLQSFQAHVPNLMHSQNHNAAHDGQQEPVFDVAAPIGFDNLNVGWVDSQHQPSPEMGRLHKLLVGWQNHQQHSGIDQHHHSGVGLGTGDAHGGVVGGSGFMFNQPLPLFGGHHGQVFTQRGPLQSSNTPSVRTWISDPSVATTSEQYLQAIPLHPQGFSGHGYNSGGFYGFHVPGRIQGEEEHDGDLKLSSASSSSHY